MNVEFAKLKIIKSPSNDQKCGFLLVLRDICHEFTLVNGPSPRSSINVNKDNDVIIPGEKNVINNKATNCEADVNPDGGMYFSNE